MSRTFFLFSVIFIVFTISTVLTTQLIPILKKRKMGQTILEIGPSWHKSKEGTPTMGGLAPVASILLAFVSLVFLPDFFSKKEAIGVILTLLYAFLNGIIGIADDWVKLKNHQNQGLTPIQKLVLQFAFAGAYLAFLGMNGFIPQTVTIPFFGGSFYLGFGVYILALFFLVGTVNCANLTDGIDGLATSVNMVVGGFFIFLAYTLLQNDLLLLGAAMTAASLSFLFFNYHPARVFMGDTGSLFFGALAGGCAFICGQPLLLLLCGVVYYVEGISVVLQVVWFKISKGKRLFRMAPFHHHLEKIGWSEEKIVFTLTLVSLFGAILAAFAV